MGQMEKIAIRSRSPFFVLHVLWIQVLFFPFKVNTVVVKEENQKSDQGMNEKYSHISSS